jgi:putative Mg2+ transporter-C (MgtC) family protein
MLEQFAEGSWLAGQSWAVILERLIIAALLSGVLGFERERLGRGAGLRTHMLVCLGATLAMAVAIEAAREWNAANPDLQADPSRMAQGVITGIGFLGGGTILVIGGMPRGLTTAAMVWFVAALGVAVGMGFYAPAGFAAMVALAIAFLLKPLERFISTPQNMVVEIHVKPGAGDLGRAEDVLEGEGLRPRSSKIELREQGASVAMILEVSKRRGEEIEGLLGTIREEFPEADSIVCHRLG